MKVADLGPPLLAVLCACGGSDTRPAGSAPGDAKEAAARILAALSGGKPSALDGVVLAWTETDAGGGQGRKLLAALARPDRLRLEVRDPAGSAVVFKVTGTGTWVGPAGGPFEAADEVRVAAIDRTFLLLGSLLAWDLRTPGAVTLTGSVLRSHATWWTRSVKPIPVARELGPDGRLRSLTVGRRVYGLAGTFRGAGGALPQVAPSPDHPGMEFVRFDPDAAFRDAYFAPEPGSGPGTIRVGGEQQNFDRPRLEWIPQRRFLELEDPGGWAARMKVLDDAGRRLWEGGQESGGLPVYTAGGTMRVLFMPRAGKPVRVPDGYRQRSVAAHHALVLYVRAPWAEAVRRLDERLRARAAELKLEPRGDLELRPYVVPGEGKPPERETAVKVRGELTVR